MPALPDDAAYVEFDGPTFQPVRILDVELSQPLPAISSHDGRTGRRYQRAHLLVRLHTRPLGLVDLNLDQDVLTAAAYADQIWRALHQAIKDHLRQDGLPKATGLDATGLSALNQPPCLQSRAQFLAEAPFVSVVVCTRNRTEQLATCLPSLLTLNYPHYEVIVVDNAPHTSATADLIGQHYSQLPQVRYVREDRPGLDWARNCGLALAQGEIIAFTDDDVVSDPDWLAEIGKGFSAARNVACVNGLILPLELETPAQILFEQFGGFNKGCFSRRIFDLAEHRPVEPLFPYIGSIFGAGANMAFRTSILRTIGGFDPGLGAGSIGLGGEECVVFFQLLKSGFQIVYEPGALVYHLHRRDYGALKKQIYDYSAGLTAFLTKCLMDNPKLIFDIVLKLPYGLLYALSPNSPKNRKKSSSYPAELVRTELKGMLYGPLAYLRSR